MGVDSVKGVAQSFQSLYDAFGESIQALSRSKR
jgi:hypothetical protein